MTGEIVEDRVVTRQPVRFTAADLDNCGWNVNCGPGALCAVLHLTPAELRPLMGDFEKKGYTNPTLMRQVLERAGAICLLAYRSDEIRIEVPKLKYGVIRVQWGGPWTKPGVPMRVRYRYTHWVAMRNYQEVFDINAIHDGGWLPDVVWAQKLIPWLIKEAVPKADGTWWPTHAWEVKR